METRRTPIAGGGCEPAGVHGWVGVHPDTRHRWCGRAGEPDEQQVVVFLDVRSPVTGTLLVYDRLWACSGILTNTTSTQTITTPGTLTAGRDPLAGDDVEPWFEVYTAPGATGATWTLTGTDATGNSGRTWTDAHPANAETAGQFLPTVPGTAIGGCQCRRR